MSKEVINPPELVEPTGYNHGIAVDGGRLVFLAGQDATGPDGELVAPGDLVGQFERALSNLATVVEAAGGSFADVVTLTVYVADRDDYLANLGPLGEVFRDYVEVYPAMALFEVDGFFNEGALVELTGVAVVEDPPAPTTAGDR